jgi:hypothetical protein
VRLVLGIKQAPGFGFVLGAQAGLPAGGGSLGVEHAAPPEENVFRFHVVMALNMKTVCDALRY